MTATRRLAAILAADVAGYSRADGGGEEGTLAAMKAIRRELGDPKIEEHRGRIVKTTGDGLLVELASVGDAVRCAVELQRAMAECNAVVPVERRIESRVVRDQVRDKLDISFEMGASSEPGTWNTRQSARDGHHGRAALPGAHQDWCSARRLRERYARMTAWLDENCGSDGWAMTPAGLRGVLKNAVSLYFANAMLAGAFVVRWCAGHQIEPAGGVFEIRDDDPAPRVGAAPHRTP